MGKILIFVMTVGLVAVSAAWADPVTDVIKSREFFNKKFPTVKFEDYANGIYSLPGFDTYREQWMSLNDMPPYEIGLERGKKLWETPFKNGQTFSSCFKNGGRDIAQSYPYWDKAAKKVQTVEMDLVACAKRNDANFKFITSDLDRDQPARVQLAELAAYFYSLSRGMRIKPDVDLSDSEALKAYEKGKEFWWMRRGQWNFACATCHTTLAGKNMGGNQPLSAALGHGTAWPAQRLEWGRIDTLQFRYITCLKQMRAKPPKYDSDIYSQIELYEKIISSGLPLGAPAMRN